MPPFSKVVNRAGVIFRGEVPITEGTIDDQLEQILNGQ
jgi:hypothetical protein